MAEADNDAAVVAREAWVLQVTATADGEGGAEEFYEGEDLRDLGGGGGG